MFKIAFYGVAQDIIGNNILHIPKEEITVESEVTVSVLLRYLRTKHPQFGQIGVIAVAKNQQYAQPEEVLTEIDEIAIIPPVSGG